VSGDKITLRHKKPQSNPPITKYRAYELSAPLQAFGLPEYPILVRPYARVFSHHSCSRKSKPEEFAHCRCPARHSVLEPEIVNGSKLFRRKHDLQALFPFCATAVPHGCNSQKVD